MSEGSQLAGPVKPIDFQPPFPADRFILQEAPDEEAVPMDVIFVGGGPAGLAGAIELARLVQKDNESDGGIGELEIGVLEKDLVRLIRIPPGAALRAENFRFSSPCDIGTSCRGLECIDRRESCVCQAGARSDDLHHVPAQHPALLKA